MVVQRVSVQNCSYGASLPLTQRQASTATSIQNHHRHADKHLHTACTLGGCLSGICPANQSPHEA